MALILLPVFAANTFYQAMMILDYRIHTTAFAEKCINKYRPQMHCNGQCQLMKKLRQQENKQEKNPELKLDNKNEAVSSTTFFASLGTNKYFVQSYAYPLSDKRTARRSDDIFHPPCIPA